MIERRAFTYYEKCKVYARNNGRCAICGKPLKFSDMTIDHKIPLSKGGTNAMSNLQAACWHCNHLKGNMMPAELLHRLFPVVRNMGFRICKYRIMKMLGFNTKDERGVVA